MNIPYIDLVARNAPLRDEYLAAMAQVVDSACFSGGPFVARFEREFATYCGTRHAIAVGSGSEALWLALKGMGIGRGDEVVTVPMTFMATIEAILLAGAKPVLVDIDPVTWTMAPSAIEPVLGPRTKAILPVHLFGQPAAMDEIAEIAHKHGLKLIEDAAQAHGAGWHGRKTGSLGHAGCFSFHPGKNLGGFGEGGAVTTDDDDLANTVRTLREHGQSRKNHHCMHGWNCRMDGLQAAVLSIRLRHLDEENRIRRSHVERYAEGLAGTRGVMLPLEPHGASHAWHIHALRVSRRASLLDFLRRHDIGYGLHYPVPVHLQPACADLGYRKGCFPQSERCAKEFVSLPVGPELDEAMIDEVIDAINSWAEGHAPARARDQEQRVLQDHAKV